MPLTKIQIMTLLADNTTEDISAEDSRDVITSILDSIDITNSDRVTALLLKEDLVNKGQPHGYPSLDATGKIPVTFIHHEALAPTLTTHLVPHITSLIPTLDLPVPEHRHPASSIDISILGRNTIFQIEEDGKYRLNDIAHDAVYTAKTLRDMHFGKAYKLPLGLVNMNPDASSTPDMVPVSDLSPLGIEHRGLNLINAILTRISYTVWHVIAEEWTGTAHQPTVEWILDLDPDYSDRTGIGGTDATSFTNMLFELNDEVGDVTSLGSQTLVHKILELETKLHAQSSRINILENAVAGVDAHAHVDAVAEITLICGSTLTSFLMCTDDPTTHTGLDLWDGAEHKIQFVWEANFTTSPIYQGWLASTKPMVWVQDIADHFSHLVDPVAAKPITFNTISHFIDIHSIITVKFDSASDNLILLKVEHGTAHAVAIHS